jgi:hypothetical protein
VNERLRELERAGRAAPSGSRERWRWRMELVRLGRLREAGLTLGDRVRILGWSGDGEGRVFRVTKSRVTVQVSISPRLCVRPTFRLPARREVVLIEPTDGEWSPW